MRHLNISIVVWSVMVALSWLPASRVYALDDIGGAYNIAPIQYYDPGTTLTSNYYTTGWYTSTPDLLKIASEGGNTVLISGLIGAWKEDSLPQAEEIAWATEQLDKADALGIKAVLAVNKNTVFDINVSDPSDPSLAWINTTVNALKNHPAVLGWQIGDEMSTAAAVPQVGLVADGIRTSDPNRQIWQVFSAATPIDLPGTNGDDVFDFMETSPTPTDVLSSDHYPWHEAGFSDTTAGGLTRLNKKALASTNNGWAGNVNVVQGFGVFNEANRRLPTLEEHRYEVFSGIASAGVRSNLKWIDWRADLQPGQNWRSTVAKPVGLEQKMITHAMEDGYDVGTVTSNLDVQVGGQSFNEVSHVLLHDDVQNKYFLVVTNNDTLSHSVDLTLSGLPVALTTSTVFEAKDGQSIALTDNGGGSYSFTDTLDSLGVGIYELATGVAPAAPTFRLAVATNSGKVVTFERNGATLSVAGEISTGSFGGTNIAISHVTGVGDKIAFVLEEDTPGFDQIQLWNADLTTQLSVTGPADPREQLIGLPNGNIASTGGGFIHVFDGTDLSVINNLYLGSASFPFTGLAAVGPDKVAFSFNTGGATDEVQLWSSDLTTQLAVLGGFDPREGLVGLGDGNIATTGGGFLHLLDGSDLSVIDNLFLGDANFPFTGLTGVGADKLAFSFNTGGATDEIQLWSSDLTMQVAVLGGFDTIVDMIGLPDGTLAIADNLGDLYILDGTDLSILGSLLGIFDPGDITDLAMIDLTLPLLGDMDGDGSVTLADVPLFVQALVDRAAYEANAFGVNADVIGDVDGSGTFDLGDLSAFGALTFSPASASASASAVPEPSSIVLTGIALGVVVLRRRRLSS